jgi:hypothetical protein
MITLESHTATCPECWARGDKRSGEHQLPDIYRIDEPLLDRSLFHLSYIDTDESCSDSEADEVYFEAAEFLPAASSRPSTPPLFAAIYPEVCPVSENKGFDLSRVCDVVKLTSMGYNYRARRQLTRNIATSLSEVESDTESFASCLEYMDEQAFDCHTPHEEYSQDAPWEEVGDSEILNELLCDEDADNESSHGGSTYYSMLGSFIRDKTHLERLEDESLEFYGIQKKYYGEWEEENNLKSRLCW